MTSTVLKVACVGAGYFAQFHYASWARIDRVKLVGSCSLDRAQAQATGLPAYTDLAAMLAETQPDVLDVIVPPSAHAASIRTALSAGIKTIICQKPFCVSLAEAESIAIQAHQSGATLIVHENFRFQPWYRAIRQALDRTAVGEVHQLTFRLRPGDGQGPNAYLDRQPYFQTMPRFMVHETAVHYVDTCRFLLGKPTSVYADLRRINPAIAGEDAGHILLGYANGVRALIDCNRHIDHKSDNLRRTMGEALIEGTTGCLELHGDGSVTHRAFGEIHETTVLPPDSWQGFGGDCVHGLQNHVVTGLLDGTAFENLADSYLDVLRIEDAIYRSAEAGCRHHFDWER